MFKFNIDDKVKVKPYGNVIQGRIILRTLQEDENRTSIDYDIRFPMGIGCGSSVVTLSEKCLQELQLEGYDYE